MTRQQFDAIAKYVDECMSDAAHDREHVNRVLGYAMALAEGESGVDYDLLIAACMLHDVGRPVQLRDPSLDHAAVGGDMAYSWLMSQGYTAEFAENVRKAIRSHRFRTGGRAETVEAQLLFDADKLDACGMMGIFRTISFKAENATPYYTLDDNGLVDLRGDAPESAVQEYKYKLEHLSDRFYTAQAKALGARLAQSQRQAMEAAIGEIDMAREKLRKIDNYLS